MDTMALPSDAFLRILPYAYDGRGPRRERAAGYLNGGGGGSILRCLSPGPGSSWPKGSAVGGSGRISERRWWLCLQVPFSGARLLFAGGGGPRMEKVAGYLKGDGGSVLRCLPPGPSFF